MSAEALKEKAAQEAIKHVESGMRVGLGTGSTAKYAILGIAEMLKNGDIRDIKAAATSKETERLATEGGIPLFEIDGDGVDVAIDGMDEVAPNLDVIKGLGGALLREKIVESRAKLFVLIGDASKRVSRLGEKTPVPVEILQFGFDSTRKDLERLGCRPVLRERDGKPFVSDNGNPIVDCYFDEPFDTHAVALAISATPGVLEHGMFLDMAKIAYVAGDDGVIRLDRP
jgi:ribose 5-phosphate isomerase A